MSSYPKHYLANVPQELRLRVLELCVHRQWHDALDLLYQNGFTQYEWYELVWFYDHAPTNLDRSAGGWSALDCGTPLPVSDVVPASAGRRNPEANLDAELQTLTTRTETLTLDAETLTPSESFTMGLDFNAPPVKVPKRSKISRLPTDIQHTINSMLAGGRPYRDIIRCLNDRGYVGFNKVNLHNWRSTGFQLWLRATHSPIQSSTVPRPAQLLGQINLGLNPSDRGVPTVL